VSKTKKRRVKYEPLKKTSSLADYTRGDEKWTMKVFLIHNTIRKVSLNMAPQTLFLRRKLPFLTSVFFSRYIQGLPTKSVTFARIFVPVIRGTPFQLSQELRDSSQRNSVYPPCNKFSTIGPYGHQFYKQ
jgi:hypothetical protein